MEIITDDQFKSVKELENKLSNIIEKFLNSEFSGPAKAASLIFCLSRLCFKVISCFESEPSFESKSSYELQISFANNLSKRIRELIRENHNKTSEEESINNDGEIF